MNAIDQTRLSCKKSLRGGGRFGRRPVVTYPPSVRTGVRKPPRKEPAGRWRAVCRLWGFDRAAVQRGLGWAASL